MSMLRSLVKVQMFPHEVSPAAAGVFADEGLVCRVCGATLRAVRHEDSTMCEWQCDSAELTRNLKRQKVKCTH